MPLVDRMECRLIASSSFLAQGGCLQLLNSSLSSMPIYYFCSLQLPPGMLKQLERIQRQCHRRKNRQDPKQSLAAWELVCRPKSKGGLILNPRIQSEALLLKHVNKFYNKLDIPWVQLIGILTIMV